MLSPLRPVFGGAYVISSAASGYEIGQTIGLGIATVVAVTTLTLAIRSGNRKTRREVAADIDRSYQKGKDDQRAEMQPWLDYWKELAQGDLRRVHAPPPPPAPPAPPGDDPDDE